MLWFTLWLLFHPMLALHLDVVFERNQLTSSGGSYSRCTLGEHGAGAGS